MIFASGAAEGASMPVVTGDRDAFFARYNLYPVPSRSRSLGADRLYVYRRESP